MRHQSERLDKYFSEEFVNKSLKRNRIMLRLFDLGFHKGTEVEFLKECDCMFYKGYYFVNSYGQGTTSIILDKNKVEIWSD